MNKIEISLFVQKFHQMFKIRERLFKFMITNADAIYSEYRFKKYKIKNSDESSGTFGGRFSILPDSIE